VGVGVGVEDGAISTSSSGAFEAASRLLKMKSAVAVQVDGARTMRLITSLAAVAAAVTSKETYPLVPHDAVPNAAPLDGGPLFHVISLSTHVSLAARRTSAPGEQDEGPVAKRRSVPLMTVSPAGRPERSKRRNVFLIPARIRRSVVDPRFAVGWLLLTNASARGRQRSRGRRGAFGRRQPYRRDDQQHEQARAHSSARQVPPVALPAFGQRWLAPPCVRSLLVLIGRPRFCLTPLVCCCLPRCPGGMEVMTCLPPRARTCVPRRGSVRAVAGATARSTSPRDGAAAPPSDAITGRATRR
jgi:hypothetical protein